MRANHQHLAGAVKDQAADRDDRRVALLEALALRLEIQVILLQHSAQLPEVFYDQVRLRGAQLLQRFVARQHRARVNAAMPRRVDVMLHIPDEERFVRDQSVLCQDFMNLLALVPDVHIRLVEIRAEAGDGRLHGEVVAVDGAQQESAELARAAEFEELKRMGQRTDRGLHLPEPAVKPSLQLRQRNVQHVPVIEYREGQAKLSAELLQAHLRPLGLRQNVVGRLDRKSTRLNSSHANISYAVF